MPATKYIALLCAAGAAGTLIRFLVQEWSRGQQFPLGTLIVNLAGCLLYGAIWGAATQRGWIGPQGQLILLTGFLGALTTFSTYAFDLDAMLRRDAWLHVILYAAMTNILGVLAVIAGRMMVGQARA